MKRHFNKELVMSKVDDEDFENLNKCRICDNAYLDNDAKVNDNCEITGKYRGSAHRYSNNTMKLILKLLLYSIT